LATSLGTFLVKYQNNPASGFTFRAPQISQELRNEIQVSKAFDKSIESADFYLSNIKPFQCVWDTGATGSVISKKVIDDLGLRSSGKTIIHVVGPSGTENEYEANIYFVNLYFPPCTVIPTKVVEGSMPGCDVLIGMNVINLGDFAVTNYNNKTTWSFRLPSCSEIDFFKEINDEKEKKGISESFLT